MNELRTLLRGSAVVLATLGLLLTGCGDDATDDEGCTTDDDCAAGQICNADGTCEDVTPVAFCDTYAATCGEVMTCGANADESCALGDCATWWDAAAEGTAADTSGATQGCYAYHLGVAGTDAASADVHCPHAKGEALCVE